MALFQLGEVVSTPGALAALTTQDIQLALERHQRGDWGELCPEDRCENNLSVVDGYRLLSSYIGQNKTKFWIITEADRSVTTILLPDEY